MKSGPAQPANRGALAVDVAPTSAPRPLNVFSPAVRTLLVPSTSRPSPPGSSLSFVQSPSLSILAVVLSQIPNLRFQISLAFDLQPFLRNSREYRLFRALLSDGRTPRPLRSFASRPSPLSLVHLLFSSLSALPPVSSQISNLKFQIPFAFSLSQDPSRSPKYHSRKPEYPPLSRNIPPYPRISPLPFAFATSSHTIISIATPRSTKNPYPDYQPLAHRKNTHWFCSILPSRTTAPGSLSQAQSGVFRANGTAPLLPDERSAISTRQTYRPLVGPNPRPSPWLGGS